jgi:type VI protein secretion system component VasF
MKNSSKDRPGAHEARFSILFVFLFLGWKGSYMLSLEYYNRLQNFERTLLDTPPDQDSDIPKSLSQGGQLMG